MVRPPVKLQRKRSKLPSSRWTARKAAALSTAALIFKRLRTMPEALADIISMVKHAARDQEPILTADERVDRAMKAVMSGKEFNEEQLKWLHLIRDHLAQNLTIEIGDFEFAPVFERQGGLGKAKKVFANYSLEELIVEINSAVAA